MKINFFPVTKIIVLRTLPFLLVILTGHMLQAAQASQNNKPHPAVARIIVPERDGISYGSGTLVDTRGEHGLVLTNWHVVRDASGDVTVVFPEGFRSEARVLKVDDDWDLAVLVIWRPKAKPVQLSQRAPRPGETLTIAGYGSGNYRSATGRCTQYVAPGANLPFEMVEVSVQARQGDSGGPIFNQQGELAGVLFGAGRGTTSGSYVGRVELFLASVLPKTNPADTAIAKSVPAASFSNRTNTAAVVATEKSETDFTFPSSPQAVPRLDSSGFDSSNSHDIVATRPTDEIVITWNSIAGNTPFQQGKTMLALIGIVAVLLQVSRLFGSGK